MNKIHESDVFPGLTHLCDECLLSWGYTENPELFAEGIENGEICDEGHFSWSACDYCNCRLGGDRFAAHQWVGEELLHYDICSDCLYLLANGSYPDDFIPCE